MLLTLMLPEEMTTAVPAPLVVTTSLVGSGTKPPLQLAALFRDVPSPAPVQLMVCASAGASWQASKPRSRANGASRPERSERGARDEFIVFSFGFSMFRLAAWRLSRD